MYAPPSLPKNIIKFSCPEIGTNAYGIPEKDEKVKIVCFFSFEKYSTIRFALPSRKQNGLHCWEMVTVVKNSIYYIPSSVKLDKLDKEASRKQFCSSIEPICTFCLDCKTLISKDQLFCQACNNNEDSYSYDGENEPFKFCFDDDAVYQFNPCCDTCSLYITVPLEICEVILCLPNGTHVGNLVLQDQKVQLIPA